MSLRQAIAMALRMIYKTKTSLFLKKRIDLILMTNDSKTESSEMAVQINSRKKVE